MPDPDTLVIEYTTADGTRRRVTYESRYPQRGYTRREAVRRGCSWEPVGVEPVVELVLDGTLDGVIMT